MHVSFILRDGHGGLVVRFRPSNRTVQGSKPDSTEYQSCIGPVARQSYEGVKRPPTGVVRSLERGVPAQASSSLSDRGSKLRGPSQNSPRVA
ncbi:hypothetical protein AVEN_26261-1 [Araneus ventricosus]|uniref:Uncharacterized protein n=1 Tax=Araneus ventricosus TaxID=182803 RepID=A0A4Y2ANM4_ARAVE|nr:hypothetical protein AVEN_26261-1 [Araneus ventricosus]